MLRNILDKLLYIDEYPTIDSNLTDTNVGARKTRNMRDTLFIINVILNEARQNKYKEIYVQLFDVENALTKSGLKNALMTYMTVA